MMLEFIIPLFFIDGCSSDRALSSISFSASRRFLVIIIILLCSLCSDLFGLGHELLSRLKDHLD